MALGRKREQDEADGNVAVLDEVDTPSEDETESLPAEAEAKPAEIVNLDAFWAAVDAVDGENPDFSSVNEEYNKLSRSGKTKAQHAIKARTMDHVESGDYAKAKNYSRAAKALASTSAPQESTDPTEELVQRIAALRIANAQLTKDEHEERVSALVEKPNDVVSALAKKLVETKMARKPRAAGSGTRHNVGKHIAQVFEGEESGTFLTAQEIASRKSAEYGDDPTNVVSVNSHLNSGKFEQSGLSVETRDGKLGVVKG